MSAETDRELLELAAKAAGYQIHIWGTPGEENCARMDTTVGDRWNPLADDGDALRLAVKLGIDLVHFNGHLRADVRGMPDVHQLHDSDPYAATRRAIVRAAAEIGKAMK